MKTTLKPLKTKYTQILIGTLVGTLAIPTVAYAAPATIAAGVSDTETLLSQLAQYAFEIVAAGAALFLIRALWTMHSADDDGQYSKGRKHLVRSIWTLVASGCVSAIIATVRSAYGI